MFFNVFIRVDDKEQLTTDCFYYNVKQVTDVGLTCEIVTEKNERLSWRTDLYGLQIEA